ncbi:hypothetical protein [Haloarcula laminariae]|uniref:hypothetical protein n=1 Tax=Haloarcula laminariae TaxID=2961577 RepID=UPI0021CA8793|nr:hypothetical protein [Halomicroarcula laminariae]
MDIQVGDKVRDSSQWTTDGIERTPRRVDKILRDENTGIRYAYLVPVSNNPKTELIPISDIGMEGEYEVVEDR